VDTNYWVATINPHDQLHARAAEVRATTVSAGLVTTEAVLIEVLNYFSAHGAGARQKAAEVVRKILLRPDVEVVVQTKDSFLAGFSLYEARLDKGYSLTDCISMCVMRAHDITDVLTHDRHFEQEGFTVLL
jgi:predicted nucleic acid-binding protein